MRIEYYEYSIEQWPQKNRLQRLDTPFMIDCCLKSVLGQCCHGCKLSCIGLRWNKGLNKVYFRKMDWKAAIWTYAKLFLLHRVNPTALPLVRRCSSAFRKGSCYSLFDCSRHQAVLLPVGTAQWFQLTDGWRLLCVNRPCSGSKRDRTLAAWFEVKLAKLYTTASHDMACCKLQDDCS